MGTTCILFGRSGPCLWQFCSSLVFSPLGGGGVQNWPPLPKTTSAKQASPPPTYLVTTPISYVALWHRLGRRYPVYGSDRPLFRVDSWHDGLVYRTHQWGTHQSSRHGGAAGDKEDLRGEGSALCGGTVSWSYNRSCILEGDYKKFATKAYILKDRKEFYTLCKTFYRR